MIDQRWSRREFLTTAALAAAGSLLGRPSDAIAAEPPPETTKLRLIRGAPICQAPQYAANELLKDEGFTDVQEVKPSKGSNTVARLQALSAGEGDIAGAYIGPIISRLDAGDSIV